MQMLLYSMDERRIVIVDSSDSAIGSKARQDVRTGDIYRASALWITNSQGLILLARRARGKEHDPGKWGPAVAGTVEDGETYESNIIKEAEEELGLKNINPVKGPKNLNAGKTYTHFTQWYLLTADKSLEEFVVQKEEVEEIRWFSKDELLDRVQKNPDEFLSSVRQWIHLLC